MDRLKNPFAPADEAVSRPNNEEMATSSDDFLAFSSTSTPAKSFTNNTNFKPKRGKSNRMGNWERFGAMNQEYQSPTYKSQRNTWSQERGFQGNFELRGTPNNFSGNQNYSNFSPNSTPNRDSLHGVRPPFRRGTPRSEPGQRGGSFYRGAPGFFGTPHQTGFNQFQNSGGYFNSAPKYIGRGTPRGMRSRGRGNNRGQYSYTSNNEARWSESGYFHPSMLEDPWADLNRVQSNKDLSSVTTSSSGTLDNAMMSDSMIPQVGDTLLERNQDIQRNTSFEENLEQSKGSIDQSTYNDSSSDEDNVIITIEETPHKGIDNSTKRLGTKLLELPVDSHKELNDSEVSKSDSLVPLVGDSVLIQDITMDI